jgi:hypothetical protein
MNKLFVSILTTATMLGSFNTVSFANGVVNKTPLSINNMEKENPFGTNSRQSFNLIKNTVKTHLEKLTEEKSSLSTRLFSVEFPTLPLSEQLSLLKQSFSLQQSIHDEYKSQLLSSNMTPDVEHLETELQVEQRNMKKEMRLFEQILTSSGNQKEKELRSSKDQIKEVLKSLQAFRSSGSELQDMLTLKQKNLQANQISVLQQVVTSSIKENHLNQAIDSLSKIVKLSEGDQDYLSFLHELLKDHKSYVLWNHELISLQDDFVNVNGRLYISTDELGKWMNVSLKKDKEEKEVMTIKNMEHQFRFDQDSIFIDGVSIGNPPVWKKDKTKKHYIDAEFLFELLGYQVTVDSEKNLITVTEAIYPIEEVDQLPADDIVNSFFR